MFKRRDKRSMLQSVWATIYPKGGWARAIQYINHRVRRLPDPPHKIARGIFIGVLMSFTPLFGLHVFAAAMFGWIVRGNVLAAVLSTFMGNPLTFPFIAAGALELGHLILGTDFQSGAEIGLIGKFGGAWSDLHNNLRAMFTDTSTDWSRLDTFYTEVFLPYLVGGMILGSVAGIAAYHITLPLITAYKNRRKGRLKARLAAIRDKVGHKSDKTPKGCRERKRNDYDD